MSNTVTLQTFFHSSCSDTNCLYLPLTLSFSLFVLLSTSHIRPGQKSWLPGVNRICNVLNVCLQLGCWRVIWATVFEITLRRRVSVDECTHRVVICGSPHPDSTPEKMTAPTPDLVFGSLGVLNGPQCQCCWVEWPQ
jgi:hypothetical protein